MAKPLDPQTIKAIDKYTGEQRYQYLLKTVVSNSEIWILTDQDGCVMLNTEDEDCVPVWPNEEFAMRWATDEWQHCQTRCISLSKWFADWTPGLMEDDLAIVIFPCLDEEGLVVYPDELHYELKMHVEKARRKAN